MKTLFTFLFVLFSINIFSQDTISDYYNEITGGSELGSSKSKYKFCKDVKIYVYGEKNDTLMDELKKIVVELNELIESVNIEIVNDSLISNVELYIGSGEYFRSFINYGSVYKWSYIAQGFVISFPNNGCLNASLVFVNTELTKGMERKKHVLREELTQSLGFGNDSYKYPDSIFYELYSDKTTYSDLDKSIIKKHYNLNN
jgi:hypothetical protein